MLPKHFHKIYYHYLALIYSNDATSHSTTTLQVKAQ